MADLHLLHLVLQAVSIPLFAAVAVTLARRRVSAESRGAQRGFVIWWAGLGFLSLWGLLFDRRYGIDLLSAPPGTVMAVLYVLLAILMAMLGGLVYYLLYLYLGRRTMLRWVVGYYVFLMIYLVALLQWMSPVVGMDARGDPTLDYQRDLGPTHPLSILFSALFILPPLAAAIGYFLLFFRVRDRTSRYRITLVSLGIGLVFLFSAGNTVASLDDEDDPQTVEELEARDARADLTGSISNGLTLLAATLVMFAFHPPPLIQKRLGVRPVGAEMQ